MPDTSESDLGRLKQLSREIRDLDVGEAVDTITTPDPTTFLRDYVASNKPALIKGAIDHWPALQIWNKESLAATAGQQLISVDVTPNGYGDAVTPYTAADGQPGLCFCIPDKRRMLFKDFLDLVFQQPNTEVPYLQQQNSNLIEEFSVLLPDVESHLEFAAAAFQAPPDAVNLWIGDERSTTTFHKDHYENLYAVVRGKKVFHLLPPTDVYRMGLQLYPAAQYTQAGGQLQPVLQQPPQQVLWCPIHPEPADPQAIAEHPLFFDNSLPKPLRVEVCEGDVLYLPAMWWHYVQQEGDERDGWCVAVNYWYDMHFGSRYAAYKLVESISEGLGLLPSVEGI
eukprot:GHUV01002923.1.p1 GENE.GHUV01002923.1~~GHUV01002923.1.p1  ORF type:complete len:339 (+),score=90.12 GHUV01002923.1:360-1376(+)